MKNILRIFSIAVIGMMALVSCEPIENRQEMTGSVTKEEVMKYVKVIPIQLESLEKPGTMVTSNYVSFRSDGLRALTSFTYGVGTFAGTFADSVQAFVVAGEQAVWVNILNPDGTVPSWSPVEFPVDVQEAFNVDPEWALFCGTGEKTWTWNGGEDGNALVWGNGGYRDNRQPSWWGRTLADIGTETNAEGEGKDAVMVFSANGATLTKIRTNNTTQAGTFSFDMSKRKTSAGNSPLWADESTDPAILWSIGKFYTSNVTVLVGKMQNKGEGPVNDYDILKLTEDEIVLAWPEEGDNTGDWGGCWYWMFKAVE